MTIKIEVGNTYKTNKYGDLVVTAYHNSKEVKVKFLETGYETTAQASHIRNGNLKDPLSLSVCGVGYLGLDGKQIKTTERGRSGYNTWLMMMGRCYNENRRGIDPTYEDVIVCPEWHDFSKFYGWYDSNYVEGFQLDKDILSEGHNKVYGPETCCFIPSELNSMFRDTQKVRGDCPEGVTYKKTSGMFMAAIKVQGLSTNLGHFTDTVEAEATYLRAKAAHLMLLLLKYSDKIDLKVSHRVLDIAMEMQRRSMLGFDQTATAA